VLILIALLILMPIYVLLMTGLKTSQAVSLSNLWLPPTTFSKGGFGEAWEKLGSSFINSVILVIPATILASLIGAVNGFIFSKKKFRGSEVLFILILFGMFIPYQVVLIPMVQTLQITGLYGTRVGLLFVHVIYSLPLSTLIFRNFFGQVPNELLEAASIDGAGLMKTFSRIFLPLSLPAFAVSSIIISSNVWNDFLFSVTIVPNPKVQPVVLALNNLAGNFSIDWNVVMAGAALTALPMGIVAIALSKYFSQAVMAGSVKG
jgi:glucose/mannose transport system permease protein